MCNPALKPILLIYLEAGSNANSIPDATSASTDDHNCKLCSRDRCEGKCNFPSQGGKARPAPLHMGCFTDSGLLAGYSTDTWRTGGWAHAHERKESPG